MPRHASTATRKQPRPEPHARAARTSHRPTIRFFGLHFDLHASDKDTELGRLVTEAMVRRILRATRPDFLQYDCKGHVGFLAYPDSKVSRSASGIIHDSLAIYRKVTAQAGVPLLMHFSGVWDGVAVQDHPEWAALDADGKPSDKYTSTFGPYVTQRMIPQMQEIVDRYDVDGFWVDGDCWAAAVDYCPQAIEQFQKITGPEYKPPTAPGQAFWVEWMRIQRDQFLQYVKTYTDALHDYCKDRTRGTARNATPAPLQLASNWLYSSMSPEPVTQPMDFISGDYNSTDSVNSARFQGRCMASVGLPWDLMAWAFAWFPGTRGSIYKPPQQLQQEAASVLALGGGFQVYFHPDRHGGFSDEHIELMKHVADFCHARRESCFQSHSVPQVGLLLDTTTQYAVSPKVFAPWQGEHVTIQGLLHALLEARHNVDIVADHQLHGAVDRWPVIAVPESDHLSPGTVRTLIDYVHRGGNLLICGSKTCAHFKDALGVKFTGEPVDADVLLHPARAYSSDSPGHARLKGSWQAIEIPAGSRNVQVIAHRSPGYRSDVNPQPAATLTKLGRGKIAAIYGPVGHAHFVTHTPWLRDFLDAVLQRLYKPMVHVTGRGQIDVIVRRRQERLLVHLHNVTTMPTASTAASEHYWFTDDIPPTGELIVTVRLDRKPRRVTLEPTGQNLIMRWKQGTLTLRVPPVHIHATLVIE